MSSRLRGAPDKKDMVSKEEEGSAEEEDFEEAVKEAAAAAASSSVTSRRTTAPLRVFTPVPEAVDDFLRNLLRRTGLRRTLGSFEAEWYGVVLKSLAETPSGAVTAAGVAFLPDAREHRRLLLGELEAVCKETEELREEVLAAGQSLLRTRRERDFHWLQHRRAAEDRSRLVEDWKQLRAHLESYEPALRQLEDKRKAALRQKMLLSLQRDRAHCARRQPDAQPSQCRSAKSSGKASDGGAQTE